MKTKYTHLFKPITIRGITLKNRILSSPLGIWALIPEDGLNESWLRYICERAAGGAATVSLGDTQVNAGTPEEEAVGKILKLSGRDVAVAYLSEFADAIHQHGALATIELAHIGSGGMSADGKGTYGPIAKKGMFPGLKMSHGQIKETVRQYTDCARTMKQAGFKMLTIHGGHGKLIDQFLNFTNDRDDEYGGSLENRMRFCIEVVDAIRAVVGEKFIIELRVSGVSPEDEPEAFEELVTLIERLEGKVDIINTSHEANAPRRNDPESLKVSGPMAPFNGETAMPGYLMPPAPNAKYAAALKARIKNTYIAAVGAIITPDIAEGILNEGGADFVLMGRPLIADPLLPKKARRNRPEDIRPCIGCLKCLDGMHGKHIMRCSVNPRIGKEYYTPLGEKALERKKVAIIGGGVAGMQAALTCAQRGHEVILLEKSGRLGGILSYFRNDGLKYRLNMLRDWFVHQIESSSVDVRLNTEATFKYLLELGPDAVILAAGSNPIVPHIPGIDGPNVMHVLPAFENLDKLPRRVAIVGGNLAGCEFAITLKDAGHEVTIIEMLPELHPGVGMSVGKELDWYMKGIRSETSARCTAVTDKGVVFERDGTETLVETDTVVYAVGMRSENSLSDELFEEFEDCFHVGDSREVATVTEAIRDGYYAALDV